MKLLAYLALVSFLVGMAFLPPPINLIVIALTLAGLFTWLLEHFKSMKELVDWIKEKVDNFWPY